MRKLYRGAALAATFALVCFVQFTAQAFVQISTVTVVSPPATSCTPTDLTITGSLGAVNYTFNGVFVTVSGSNITVDVDYTSPQIILPAIGSFSHTANLGNLAPGTYTVTVNGVLSGSVSNTFAPFSLPVVSCCPFTPGFTKSGTSGCPGDVISFTNATTAGATSYTWRDNGALFSTSTNASLSLSGPGLHTITMMATDGSCSDSTSQTVLVTAGPEIQLGNDTVICDGTPLTLDAGSGSTFIWSDNSSSQTLTASTAGTYAVTVTASNGCFDSDTLSILSVNPVPVINLGSDTSVCEGDSITLDAGAGLNYLWSNSATTQTISVGPGLWICAVTDGFCNNADTVLVANNPGPQIGFPATTTSCGDAVLDAGAGSSSYLWSDGSTGQSIVVSTSGTYSLTVTDSQGCPGSDSLEVIIEEVPNAELGNDTTICDGETWLIQFFEPGVSYNWSNGSNVGSFLVSFAGTVWLEATGSNNCVASDTIEVTYEDCNTGIPTFGADSPISLFPNPTNGPLTVNLPSDLSSTLEVTDLTGRSWMTLQHTASNTLNVSLEDLPAGLYLIEVTQGPHRIVQRIVLQ